MNSQSKKSAWKCQGGFSGIGSHAPNNSSKQFFLGDLFFPFTFFTIWVPKKGQFSFCPAGDNQQSPGRSSEMCKVWRGATYSALLWGLMTQSSTARLIANLPPGPFSLMSPSGGVVVTFIAMRGALGFLCGAPTLSSYKHLATGAFFIYFFFAGCQPDWLLLQMSKGWASHLPAFCYGFLLVNSDSELDRRIWKAEKFQTQTTALKE